MSVFTACIGILNMHATSCGCSVNEGFESFWGNSSSLYWTLVGFCHVYKCGQHFNRSDSSRACYALRSGVAVRACTIWWWFPSEICIADSILQSVETLCNGSGCQETSSFDSANRYLHPICQLLQIWGRPYYSKHLLLAGNNQFTLNIVCWRCRKM